MSKKQNNSEKGCNNANYQSTKNKFFFNLIIAMVFVTLLTIATITTAFAASSSFDSSSLVEISLLNQDPDPAFAGELVEVRLKVSNLGGVSSGYLMLDVLQNYPLSITPGDSPTIEVGTINGYQGLSSESFKVIKFTILVNKEATEGTYFLKIKSYTKESSISVERQIPIVVKSRTNAQEITIDKNVITPGKITPISFTLNNVGGAPLRNVIFTWANSENIILPVGNDNTKYIKYLDIGESIDLNFSIVADANANAGLYKLLFTLSYKDPVTLLDTTATKTAGIYVGGGTDFDVAYSDSSSGLTSFTLANIGSNPATSVLVTIPPQQSWSTSGTNTVIIGNLNKGDYTVASFKLQSGISGLVGGISNGSANMRNFNRTNIDMPTQRELRNNSQIMQSSDSRQILLKIDYTDTMGDRQSVIKTVNMVTNSNSTSPRIPGANSFNLTNQQSTLQKYQWYIVITAIILVAAIYYYRKKKNRQLLEDSDDFKQKRHSGEFKKKE